jgi:hypothetical protein
MGENKLEFIVEDFVAGVEEDEDGTVGEKTSRECRGCNSRGESETCGCWSCG